MFCKAIWTNCPIYSKSNCISGGIVSHLSTILWLFENTSFTTCLDIHGSEEGVFLRNVSSSVSLSDHFPGSGILRLVIKSMLF